MFNATVAQKPTIPVSDGTKKRINSPVVLNLLGLASTGPNPPAFRVIHQNIISPTHSMNGALTPCRNLMLSIPHQITAIFSAQNAKKQIHGSAGCVAAPAHNPTSTDKIPCPPIHSCIPNHPTATNAPSPPG